MNSYQVLLHTCLCAAHKTTQTFGAYGRLIVPSNKRDTTISTILWEGIFHLCGSLGGKNGSSCCCDYSCCNKNITSVALGLEICRELFTPVLKVSPNNALQSVLHSSVYTSAPGLEVRGKLLTPGLKSRFTLQCKRYTFCCRQIGLTLEGHNRMNIFTS